ncbi:hypothetical protein EVJ32_04690 [Exiguobacterium sp. SH5S4]|uniref:Rho termination factor N-terminal domain-containing protein n=1 Tax=Exiguobacterium sp. SH5S4 TaxID=2510961 RepID=UPI00103D04E6|nr:Rho termination factor N-terminal domain-containing protein [Exiguobacterium sp. SH5S4]TCI26675.1 hypothetical protein EVJ32_04690 [Exiguobacterium sp. SH5S4]
MNITDKTQKELYSLAKELNIAGRSRMNKSELLTAIETVRETARTTTASNTDHEKAEAFKTFSLLTDSHNSNERTVIKQIDGKTRYFSLSAESYVYAGLETRYHVKVTEREFKSEAPKGRKAWTLETLFGQNEEELKALLLNEIHDYMAETKAEDGRPYIEIDRRLEEVETLTESIGECQTCELIYESKYKKVWRSRMTKEDGDDMDNAITIEYNNMNTYRWETVDRYEAKQNKQKTGSQNMKIFF